MTGVTITDFIAANLARIEQDRCNRVEITNDPVTVGGRLVQYVGMSGDGDGTYVEVRDPRVDAMTPPGGDVPRITRILTPAERDEFLGQCPLSDRAREARRWVAAIRAVVAMHRPAEWRPVDCGVCLDPETPAGDYWMETYPCPTIRAIARIWADRDGWQEAWR